jgi:serine/threonine protein kinase/Flp pilus assembly protein TadD
MNPTDDGCPGHNGVAQQAEPGGNPRLAQALEEYRRLLEAGSAPDRATFQARHPEVAEELAECLSGLEFVHAVAPALSGAAAGVAAAGDAGAAMGPGTPLGDFRIVRQVGRGGMGVVYEAEQLSLRRRVALKVLPLAGVLDGTQLQRFRNEAQAAAGLHHSNIVPVYAVGCERGVHFYAMQFIDGQSLADLLRQLRQPAAADAAPEAEAATTAYAPAAPAGEAKGTASTQAAALLSTAGGSRGREYFRAVAGLGVQAAEALDYGHRIGVVHRDVKPANLLLDGAGRLWVTDFGLAQVQGAESLTATGELVGTLRYMSPEQALGKRVVIDHRADVYSLGATLYELLTLRPPFGGADRQELLRQITFEEPLAPRRLDKAIPAELETIVLKALEKNPADRYATAQELADDLRRFLEDRPIQARRPSVLQRLRKWARRRRAIVGAAAVLLAVLLVLGGGFAAWRMQQRVVAESQTELALAEAQRFEDAGNWPEALLAAQRAEPLLKAGLLDAGLRRRVQERLDDLKMVKRLEEIRLQKAPAKEVHFDTAQADPAYAQAFRDYGIDVAALGAAEAAGRIRARGIRVELAAALDDWADVCRKTRDKADTTWKDLLGLARAADSDDLRNRLRDALERRDVQALNQLAAGGGVAELPPSTLALLGDALGQSGAVEEAVVVFRQGQRRHPANFWINYKLAVWLGELGPAHDEKLRYYTVAVALRPLSPVAHNSLGYVLSWLGQQDEAIAEHREALRLNKDDAEAHNGLGRALRLKGQPDEAIAELREALRLQKDDSDTHNNLGNALQALGRLDEAIAEYREAARLEKDSPAPYINLGLILRNQGQLIQSAEAFRRGHELASRDPRRAYGTAQLLRQAEEFVRLEERLPAILRGEARPKDAAECLAFGQVCVYRRHNAAAAHFYAEAFAAEPKLCGECPSDDRYNAACAAALAGCGQGKDAGSLDAKQRAGLRRQALDWLRSDLQAFRRLLNEGPDTIRPDIVRNLRHWLMDPDFAGVRGERALAALPAAERPDWQQLWQEVEALRQRAARPQEKTPTNRP